MKRRMIDCAALGEQHSKREIFKLFTHPLHTHAPGKRRVDIHCLSRFLGLLVRLHRADCAHVVQPVGQFDQDHAQILGHGHEELAKVFGLLGLGR